MFTNRTFLACRSKTLSCSKSKTLHAAQTLNIVAVAAQKQNLAQCIGPNLTNWGETPLLGGRWAWKWAGLGQAGSHPTKWGDRRSRSPGPPGLGPRVRAQGPVFCVYMCMLLKSSNMHTRTFYASFPSILQYSNTEYGFARFQAFGIFCIFSP